MPGSHLSFQKEDVSFYQIMKSILPHHLTLSAVKKLRDNVMAICNNQILCLENMFQIMRSCLFFLNMCYVYANAFTVILNGLCFSTSPILKLLYYVNLFCFFPTFIYYSIFSCILFVHVFQSYYCQC